MGGDPRTLLPPLIPDNGASRTGNPDGDGLNNTEERFLGTDLCKADTDGDGRNDGPATDNCPRIASPFEFLDMNGDGEGNPCDNDADGDLCEKQYDANDLDPHSLCYAGRDRFSPRRFMRAAEEDLRIFHFLDTYLENLGALVPRDCGGIPCPPPIGQWTDPQFETISIVRGADFGLGAADGFGWTSELLSDLDGRGRRDYAISAPWADGGTGGIDSGAVLLISRRGRPRARPPAWHGGRRRLRLVARSARRRAPRDRRSRSAGQGRLSADLPAGEPDAGS